MTITNSNKKLYTTFRMTVVNDSNKKIMKSLFQMTATEKEEFFKAELSRIKKEEKLKQQARDREIRKEAKNILRQTKNQKSLASKLFSKKLLLQKIDDKMDLFINQIPRRNLASQVKSPVKLAADGGNLQVGALGWEDVVEEGREGETQVNLRRVRKEAIERVKKMRAAKRKAQAARKAAQAARVTKITKGVKSILNIGKIVSGALSIETIGITLVITILIWKIQIVGAHILRIKYIPKLAMWEWACVIVVDIIWVIFNAPFFIVLALITLAAYYAWHPGEAIAAGWVLLGALWDLLKSFGGDLIEALIG